MTGPIQTAAPEAGELWAITCYYNPVHWRSRPRNYRIFRDHLKAPLVTVEFAPDGQFELGPGDADILVRVTRGDILWQKERLLNLALTRLPPECGYVAWLDCDIVFDRPDWREETLRLLREHALVHMLDRVWLLEEGRAPGLADNHLHAGEQISIVKTILEAGRVGAAFDSVPDRKRWFWTSGMAWAARRDMLEAHTLYDRFIIGSADTGLVCAAFGDIDPFIAMNRMGPKQREHFQAWAQAFHGSVQGRVGYLRGKVEHLWHGEIRHRRYLTRQRELADYDFDPERDVEPAPDGGLVWATPKTDLHEAIRSYFATRREDGVSEPPPAAPTSKPMPRAPSVQRLVRLTTRWSPVILVAQHQAFRRNYYDVLLRWIEACLPEARPWFVVEDLPSQRRAFDDVVLCTSWLQDPVEGWSEASYWQMMRLEASCALMGIPVVNQVRHLVNATKFECARRLSALSINTPSMARITNHAEFRETLLGLKTPLMVREEWGHWDTIVRAETAEEARAIDLARFKRPLAVEIIDVSHPRDGMFRKYRYIVAGDHGVPQHLQISEGWITRGNKRVVSEETEKEELAYITRPDPHHELFQRARRALQLDLLGFDYGYDREGKMFVWEVNPLPRVVISPDRISYRNPIQHATLLAMLRMYLDAARIPYPARLRDAIECPRVDEFGPC